MLKKYLIISILAGMVAQNGQAQRQGPVALAIHGGAGVITPGNLSPEKERAVRQALEEAVQLGYRMLKEGKPAVEVVQAVVVYLEDCPHFNAGRGAVQNDKGGFELDAAIMDGRGRAGAVAGLTSVKNPILAASRVMDATEHVFMVGPAANGWAKAQGLEQADASWFYVPRTPASAPAKGPQQPDKHGTVGCVAMDLNGNLAAATSTGGTARKLPGRVGDAPVIGAGTYAENGVCAVSATGHGEYFIRHVVAYDVAARMKYGSQTLQQAAEAVVHQVLKPSGGSGGLIAIDHQGHIAMPFNTPGMYRAAIDTAGTLQLRIYAE